MKKAVSGSKLLKVLCAVALPQKRNGEGVSLAWTRRACDWLTSGLPLALP